VDETNNIVRDRWKIGLRLLSSEKLSTALASHPHRLHKVILVAKGGGKGSTKEKKGVPDLLN
jgi:hypothetical protein